ncbi:MAG: outer membrane protein assembly factor BamB family protein [Planctomycetota bacterium]
MTATMRRSLRLTAGLVLLATLAAPAAGEDWPQWLGPRRDGVWRESGILERFPEGGPRLRWRAAVSGGYAGPSVAAGRVFVPDFVPEPGGPGKAFGPEHKNRNYRRVSRSGTERLLCLDEATGRVLWKHARPVTYTHAKLYANGPRTTPLVDGESVYALGGEGRLSCLDAATGRERWGRDLKSDYHIDAPTWGFATHPIVDGNKLIAIVGGEGTAFVAFDKRTGRELWRAGSCRNPGYAQLAIHESGGTRQLFAWRGEGLSSIAPETGRVYWSSPVKPMHQMTIGMPRLEGRLLYIMSWGCSRAFELDPGRPAARVIWEAGRDRGVGGQMNVPWIEDGHVYAGGLKGVYRCAELATGKRVWETKRVLGDARVWIGNVFTVKQGDRYFLATETGDLVIARLSPDGYDEIDRARVMERTNVTGGKPIWWSHPAFANRSVYVRNDEELRCYSLAADGGDGPRSNRR